MPRLAGTFAIVVLTIAAGVGASWPAIRQLSDHWKNTELLSYAHGYIIAALSAWLIWRARPEVEAAGSAPSWPFVILTGLLSIAWYLAWISGLEIGYEVLLPLILLAAVAGAVGLGAVRAVGFGIGFACFALPLWDHLVNSYLLSLSTRGVTVLARLTGLPAYIEGNTVHIPSGSLLISGGCSGVNYFLVALAIAALHGELNRDRLRHRVLLLAIAAAMAIFMNWVRIYGIVLNAHLTDMKGYLVAVDHYRYGWVLFGVMLVGFFWIARRIAPVGDPVQVSAQPRPVAAAAPLPTEFIAVLAALAIGPSLTTVAEKRTDDGAYVDITLPNGSGGWLGPTGAVPRWMPEYPKADAEVIGEYQRDGMSVAAYVNVYAYQTQGHELIAVGNSMLGDSSWQADTSRQAVARGTSANFSYVEVIATAPSHERWVIAYVYYVGGRTFIGSITSKLYYGIAVLQGRPWSGVVVVASKCAVNCFNASAAVSRFMSDNGGRLVRSFEVRRAGT